MNVDINPVNKSVFSSFQDTIVVIYIYERAAASCKTLVNCAKEVARDYKVSYSLTFLRLIHTGKIAK